MVIPFYKSKQFPLDASRSKPGGITKKNRILPTKTENKKKVEDHPRTNKSVLGDKNRLWYMDSVVQTYDGESFQTKKFVKKLLGKVRFRNDHFGAIMGYGE
ncbi:hypothetical protein Tco_0857865 [Tanacetum coccineum]|uniref:Integrase, catalytic region, zinc finger, CCHC-type, peptidase aspartic, catalytic n=1 Tax=Tanacetum coccineum TaxID=301880 RepID=A0ABQ5B8I2_9ASTR